MWYVWICNACAGTLTINYDATEADYLRFRKCGCKHDGEYEWSHNHNDGEKVYKP
jgi:hypothetical protein